MTLLHELCGALLRVHEKQVL